MTRFLITFGMRYTRDVHPTFPPAHPDGHVVIEARNEPRARGIAQMLFANQYAFIYEDTIEHHVYSPTLLATFVEGDRELGRILDAAMASAGDTEIGGITRTHVAAWLAREERTVWP